MKKLLLVAAAVSSIGAAHAQLEKGRILLGGGIAFRSERYQDHQLTPVNTSKQRSTDLGLTAGVFVQSNLLAGVQLYSANGIHSIIQYDNGYDDLDLRRGGGLLLRRYFPVGGRFYFQIQGGLGYERTAGRRYPDSQPSQELVNHMVSLQVGTGVSYAFGRRLLFDVALGNLIGASYNVQRTRDNTGSQASRQRDFRAGIGPTGNIPFNIGFNILLGK